jgi:hypothetical protein
LDKHFKQTADIDLTGCTWTPIDRFSGSYDGGGHTISGLTFNDGNEDEVGMFSEVDGGSVTRVVLVDVDVNGDDFVGGLVGYLNGGSVTSSSVSGTVSGADYVGGLVGYSSDGAISRSSSSADVEGEWLVGGLVGDNGGGSIFASFATGDVTASGRQIGGLAGRSDGTITDSYALGRVTFDVYSNDVGGLVGSHANAGSIVRSYFAGTILDGADPEDRATAIGEGSVVVVGGLVGVNSFGATTTVTDSFWDTDISELLTSAGGTGRTTVQMIDIATFGAWSIVDGWAAYAPSATPARVWGICEAENGGYPFLLWQYESDPCGGDDGDDNGGSSASSTPVLTGGAAPSLPAGQGVWQRSNGSNTPLVASSPTARQLRYSADGVAVTLTGAAGTSVANGLVVAQNGVIDCEVCTTLAAGGVIEAWMFSDPRLVAAHRIADLPCQRFSIPVGTPLDGAGPLPAGAHTLQLALPTASGMQAVNVGVTVGGRVPTRVPAGEGSVPSGAVLFVLLAAAGALVAGRRLAAAG